ncbi:hypothetical protein KIS1582_3535 [Cytobacillus firmus]|uniref:Uncharacterized protein n=1 Tax=Cytobacillus firmus TaxID=1399 RepID=A0A800N9M9_CYTFI|nr:hypothetical protein KIS1582_3535 [Cytobacillus firmus]
MEMKLQLLICLNPFNHLSLVFKIKISRKLTKNQIAVFIFIKSFI